MSKVQNFAEIAPNIPFTEFNFYDLYRKTFENTELGRIRRLLPLHEMAENLGLVRKSIRPKLGRKSYFTPEGKVALMFLKMKTQATAPQLLEQLVNSNFVSADFGKISFSSFRKSRFSRFQKTRVS